MMGYVYVMRSTGLFLRCKIGVTKNIKNRVNEVDVTTRGRVSYVVYFKFWFPYFTEGLLHFALMPFRARRMKGASGGTEWFWVPPLVGGMILFFTWCISIVLSLVFFSIVIIGLIKIGDGGIESAINFIHDSLFSIFQKLG